MVFQINYKRLQDYQACRHFSDVIILCCIKYVIKMTSQFFIFKPPLSKILVASLNVYLKFKYISYNQH